MEMDRIDQIIDKHQGEASSLIQILLDIQSENHWLPKEALDRVGERLDVPLSRIQHIATFYKAFSLVPKGRHEVHICVGTACHALLPIRWEISISLESWTPRILESFFKINSFGDNLYFLVHPLF